MRFPARNISLKGAVGYSPRKKRNGLPQQFAGNGYKSSSGFTLREKRGQNATGAKRRIGEDLPKTLYIFAGSDDYRIAKLAGTSSQPAFGGEELCPANIPQNCWKKESAHFDPHAVDLRSIFWLQRVMDPLGVAARSKVEHADLSTREEFDRGYSGGGQAFSAPGSDAEETFS
jgi:hypothetical protein